MAVLVVAVAMVEQEGTTPPLVLSAGPSSPPSLTSSRMWRDTGQARGGEGKIAARASCSSRQLAGGRPAGEVVDKVPAVYLGAVLHALTTVHSCDACWCLLVSDMHVRTVLLVIQTACSSSCRAIASGWDGNSYTSISYSEDKALEHGQ